MLVRAKVALFEGRRIDPGQMFETSPRRAKALGEAVEIIKPMEAYPDKALTGGKRRRQPKAQTGEAKAEGRKP